MNLTETLQYYRKRQGLSQIELADALEVSRQTVSKWETGAALPSAENLLALSKLYGVTVDTLLNGETEERAPELIPLTAEPPAAPPDPALLPRRKLVLRVLAVLLPCDLLFFFMDVSLYGSKGGFLTFAMLARILTCCAIGLIFAWQDRRSPANKRNSLLLGGAFLALGLYVLLMPTPLLWRLYDLIVWTGLRTEQALFPPNSLRTFIGWTLCDSCAIFAHACLVIFFQLGRLGFSRMRLPAARPQPLSHI